MVSVIEKQNIFYEKPSVLVAIDKQVKKLIQVAMAPNKEVIGNLELGLVDKLSATYTNIVDNAYAYAMGNPTQRMETTAGTLFGAYNAVTGYYQNVRSFKDGDAKLKSIMNGTAKQRAQVAFDLCVGFAKNGADALNLN